MNSNPLLQAAQTELPPFSDIQPEHILPALDAVLDENRARLSVLLEEGGHDWQHLMQPMEVLDERLSRLWGPVNHLNAVCDSDELRPVYQQGLMKLTAYQTELTQNEVLFSAIRDLHDSPVFQGLNHEQKQVLRHALRDFRLGGAELPPEKKTCFKEIQMRLSELGAQFEQHILDATRAFELHLEHERDLAGVPQSIRDAASKRARAKGTDGWLFTLDAPSYIPFMQYAEHRELRRKMYTAYVTRATDGAQDNTLLISEILKLKQEAAQLLGYNNYGEVSLATKMAGGSSEVIDFLRDLARRGKPHAQKEAAELEDFAATELGLETLEAWDVAFAAEYLRQRRFNFSQEDLKPYFPEQQVLEGLFAVAQKLYDIRICERGGAPVWHPDARFFDIFDAAGERMAGFYLDPYARPHKRGGAWMDECIIRWRKPDGTLQLPVAYLVCNFDAPVGDKPALWTHEEVITLFHEFGHGLHHMLTQVETLDVSGIRGVPWDAVELPSQFMENFCWERDALDLFARHFETGEKLPDALFDKMRAAKTFHSGMQMLRQVELALFDFLLHTAFDPEGKQSVQNLLDTVRDEVAVLKPPSFNRFQNSFSHIFAGGYAAGYYSYKWAEVLSADAFSAFEEAGIFDAETAAELRKEVLSVGGSRDIMEAFIAFRGRKPTVNALLRHSGLEES